MYLNLNIFVLHVHLIINRKNWLYIEVKSHRSNFNPGRYIYNGARTTLPSVRGAYVWSTTLKLYSLTTDNFSSYMSNQPTVYYLYIKIKLKNAINKSEILLNILTQIYDKVLRTMTSTSRIIIVALNRSSFRVYPQMDPSVLLEAVWRDIAARVNNSFPKLTNKPSPSQTGRIHPHRAQYI